MECRRLVPTLRVFGEGWDAMRSAQQVFVFPFCFRRSEGSNHRLKLKFFNIPDTQENPVFRLQFARPNKQLPNQNQSMYEIH